VHLIHSETSILIAATVKHRAPKIIPGAGHVISGRK
jgi:hypothetical protein